MTTLRGEYERRYREVLPPIVASLQQHLQELFAGTRVDRVSVRAKSVDRFVAKAEKLDNGAAKYEDPLSEIQDQIGARVVVFYLCDLPVAEQIVRDNLRFVEEKALEPEKESEFGYFGKHFILFIPSDVLPKDSDSRDMPTFFELQIKTLFQHAWAEANHDLFYKPNRTIPPEDKRRFAFAAAQSWGADLMFDDLAKRFGNDKAE